MPRPRRPCAQQLPRCPRAPAPVLRVSWLFLLDQRNPRPPRAESDAEQEQAAAPANRWERREQPIPLANQYVQAEQGALSGPGKGGTSGRSAPLGRAAVDSAPELAVPAVGAGGGLGQPEQAGSRSRRPRFGVPVGRSTAGEAARGRGGRTCSQSAASALTAGAPSLERTARGGDGDSDGSDGGGASGAGEARGQGSAGRSRGRWARRLTVGLCPQEEEFRWLLHDEVHAVLRQLQDILKVRRLAGQPCCVSFPGRSACCGRDARCVDQALSPRTWSPVRVPAHDCPLNHKQLCERSAVGLE